MIRHAELKRERHIFLTGAVYTAYGVKDIEKMQCQCGDDECWRGVGLKPREFKRRQKTSEIKRGSERTDRALRQLRNSRCHRKTTDVVKSRGH